MRKVYWFIGLLVYWSGVYAQGVEQKLENAVKAFEADSQMRHAIMGFAVMDAKTGAMVYERHSQIGLAPASTQKIFTSIAGFELLGKDYRYRTRLGYSGKIEKGVLKGDLYIAGSGDPSLGSWRYANTKDSIVIKDWLKAVKATGIKKVDGLVKTNASGFSYNAIPDGWIWQDIGNYYGAGAYQLNWKENQYNIVLRSGKNVNDTVSIKKEVITSTDVQFYSVNELRSAAKGTGDNAYIYLPIGERRKAILAGTIPVEENSFTISGASYHPASDLVRDLSLALSDGSVPVSVASGPEAAKDANAAARVTNLHTYQSPPFDSLNYWFMRRSINLYGEAFVKTIAYEKKGFGETNAGVQLVRDLWASKGIDKAAINIIDGSGLSPQNRVTADALVKALQFARTRAWYASFYESLPTYNGMKLKSGSIGGARAFAGYHTSAQGKEYIIAIIVNNHAGSSGEVVRKMYKVLDVLK